ncbi:hypothetical protein GCM10018781_60490 [Kitasatospora indigofera]|uniref:Uncharacterized protein n=1 Tax=Kitasatospora indigofera TaxID=67307 RepID=A0A919GAI5_9ACTN|nr:hypothetical protein GCM10018781_60490 [Kitasatospora indigofera]
MTNEDPRPDRGTLPPARTVTALADRPQDQDLQLLVVRPGGLHPAGHAQAGA